MIKSNKFWPQRGNLIPVWELPGEYYINLREPWQQGDPGTPETFSCGLTQKNYEKVYNILKEIVERNGGRIGEKINVYGSVFVKDMTEEAMDEICGLEYVHSIGPNVSILPPASSRYYGGESEERPETYEEDILNAAYHLDKHGVLR